MDLPCVSVIMAVYNAEPYLKQAIDSIMAQTEARLELIVVDDGSTDRSRLVLDAYSDSRLSSFGDLRKGFGGVVENAGWTGYPVGHGYRTERDP